MTNFKEETQDEGVYGLRYVIEKFYRLIDSTNDEVNTFARGRLNHKCKKLGKIRISMFEAFLEHELFSKLIHDNANIIYLGNQEPTPNFVSTNKEITTKFYDSETIKKGRSKVNILIFNLILNILF